MRRRKPEPEMEGWRIITQKNEPLGKVRYRLWRPGYLYGGIPPRSEDFDTWEEALAAYHERASWEKVDEVQP